MCNRYGALWGIIRGSVTDSSGGGNDATALFYTQPNWQQTFECLQQKCKAGNVDKTTLGCFITQLVLHTSMVTNLLLVLVRFFMALYWLFLLVGSWPGA